MGCCGAMCDAAEVPSRELQRVLSSSFHAASVGRQPSTCVPKAGVKADDFFRECRLVPVRLSTHAVGCRNTAQAHQVHFAGIVALSKDRNQASNRVDPCLSYAFKHTVKVGTRQEHELTNSGHFRSSATAGGIAVVNVADERHNQD